MRYSLLAVAAAAALITARTVLAGPLPVGNIVVGDGGPAEAIYVGFSAADTDTAELALMGSTPFFVNKTTLRGTEVSLGVFAAGKEIPLELSNLTTGEHYFTGPASRNPDDVVHAFVGSNPMGIPGFGTLPLAARTYALGLEATNVVFVGFEDLIADQADFDYNDLVLAVTGADPHTGVPEPASLALLGTGILLAGLYLRRGRPTVYTGL